MSKHRKIGPDQPMLTELELTQKKCVEESRKRTYWDGREVVLMRSGQIIVYPLLCSVLNKLR